MAVHWMSLFLYRKQRGLLLAGKEAPPFLGKEVARGMLRCGHPLLWLQGRTWRLLPACLGGEVCGLPEPPPPGGHTTAVLLRPHGLPAASA